MQVLGMTGKILFHQGHSEALGDAAMDLPFNQSRINRLAHIVSGNDAEHLGSTQFHIHLNHRQLRCEGISTIGLALPLRVEGGCRWVKKSCTNKHDTVFIGFQPQ